MIFSYLMFCIYASLEGLRDAVIFSEYYKKSNFHWLFLLIRCVTGLLAAIPYHINGDYNTAAGLFLAFGLIFPFMQLTFYYETRRMLGHPYFNFFTDKSSTSNARKSFTFKERVIMAISSICLIVYIVYINGR